MSQDFTPVIKEMLAEKDAEIERLLLKHAKEQNVLLTSLEAAATEIARLNAEFDCVMYVSALRAKRLAVCIPLITELADALAYIGVNRELVQRAREATK